MRIVRTKGAPEERKGFFEPAAGAVHSSCGAMASDTGRLSQQALAVLDVALRVPCIFIIDAICNSHSDPADGWTGTAGQVLLRVLGKSTNQPLFHTYTCF